MIFFTESRLSKAEFLVDGSFPRIKFRQSNDHVPPQKNIYLHINFETLSLQPKQFRPEIWPVVTTGISSFIDDKE
jgi:hypothetical protein